ncbi:MAG: hypothetical protein DRI92_06175 [Aquificota bacterium]|nr:MAG: hypothetical protein DRI92_06175 [Aquificota bacterium]
MIKVNICIDGPEEYEVQLRKLYPAAFADQDSPYSVYNNRGELLGFIIHVETDGPLQLVEKAFDMLGDKLRLKTLDDDCCRKR